MPSQNKVIVNNADDRLNSIPTNWWTIAHQSVQDVQDTLATRNARIVDLSLEQTAPSYLLTVTYVENTGPYFKGSAWYPGIDAASLATEMTANNARLTVLKGYDAGGGQIRFLAVMILNSGKDTNKSWYYPDLPAAQRPQVRVIDTRGPWFTAMTARVRAEKLVGLSLCDLDLPSQVK